MLLGKTLAHAGIFALMIFSAAGVVLAIATGLLDSVGFVDNLAWDVAPMWALVTLWGLLSRLTTLASCIARRPLAPYCSP
ncbi:MAG: hypothetical protein R3C68_14155 [Myxococcota bacterium]